ncbi:MAG TPA: helix-turn-helix transcriptional regulator [Acidimicrobiales bacterium]|nr:helix-turn-helix transcriptional regulator [Acidimicrobiales bacterium]
MEDHSPTRHGAAILYPGALAHARKTQRLSQAELSLATRQVGSPISESTIAMLERGRRQPSPETLTILASVLGQPIESIGRILDGEEQCSQCRGTGTVPRPVAV